jgi:hypothetical protein
MTMQRRSHTGDSSACLAALAESTLSTHAVLTRALLCFEFESAIALRRSMLWKVL